MRILIFLMLFSLTGCSIFPYEENFACESMNEFGQCVDVNGAYEYATTGKKRGTKITKHGTRKKPQQAQPIVPKATQPKTKDPYSDYQASVYQRLHTLVADPSMPIVKQPEVLRTLILDYSDGSHIGKPLYAHRFIYFMGSEPEWVMNPYRIISDTQNLPVINEQP